MNFFKMAQIVCFHNFHFCNLLSPPKRQKNPALGAPWAGFFCKRKIYFFRTNAFFGILQMGQVQSGGSSSKPKLGSLYT